MISIRANSLRQFRRRLTNLSSRNRSLVLTSLPVSQFLDLHEADFLLNKPSFSLISDLIGRKASIPLCDVLDARLERSNEVSRKLRRIDRTARFIEEERGTEDLYVGWPFVRGKFIDGTVVHGPLLFFPGSIQQRGKHWTLTRRGDEVAFLNPTFLLAYGQFNQIKLPDDVTEKSLNDFDRDPLVFRTQLYEWLRDGPLEINFNPDLFTDQLQYFDKQNAKSLGQLERTGELKLYSEAVLGIFPQAGSYLVPDYDALMGREEGEVVEERYETWPPSPPSSTTSFLPEKNIHTPLPMDASQEAALRAVRAGQSLVVQGPPGTGKSQLIANLMADAAAAGKRVLLVCQKRAALDVVQERLRQVGMGSFLALVHDFQDDRRPLFAQIAAQIDQLEVYRQQNNGLNTVLLERDFDRECRQIDDAVAELQTFKDALFDATAFGLSAKELYLSSNPDTPVIPVGDVYQQFYDETVDDFSRRLSSLAAYRHQLGLTHAWEERVSFADFTNADQTRVDQTIVQWAQTRDRANQLLTDRLGHSCPLPDLQSWQEQTTKLTAIVTRSDLPQLWPLVLLLRNTPTHAALTQPETRLTELADAWDETLARPGPEASLPTAELRSFRELLTDALDARPSWVRWNWWLLTNAGKDKLRSVAQANSLLMTTTDLQTLARMVDKRIRLEGLRFDAGPLLLGLPLPGTPESLRLAWQARSVMNQLAELILPNILPTSYWQHTEQFRAVVDELLTLSQVINQQRTDSQRYLTNRQTQQIWDDATAPEVLRQSLRRDFDLLLDADRLKAGFSETEKLITSRLETTPVNVWADTFRNSLYLAWLDHIEQQHPSLRMVSSLRMAQTEQQLQHSIQQKQSLSREILLIKLREQTYRNLTVNRLNNVVTYRDLWHQTTKKRSIWPVRKLMSTFADEVFKLVPCWLASPETVSAVFPLREDLFDLVIFDEASQCFAEQGIPAMARAKQVVITGDTQQLRPSDLYRTRLDEAEPDEDMPAELEAESLLELAAQSLPQVSLTEHYRSRSLDLITFSNQRFYQNRLQLLPFFADANQYSPAIRYVKATGVWQQNTNPIEANAVLQLLDQIAIELPGRSVGIVTFNQPQQQLILDKLEERDADNHSENRPALLVKNIENVQGDERDVIIFSVGYAPDERGKLTMQFGSLNQQGGENRLNVAVTRARERVYIVTSIWPDQLRVDEVANEGPRLLKEYLQYALNVSEGKFRPIPAIISNAPVGLLLRNQLATKHPNWQPELPFADLTVKAYDAYQSLVLTDDDVYYRQTPKQAHAYLPASLKTRQWPFRRVWSREFWRSKVTESRLSD
ncbi:MAG: AAA family ATPase [Spirosoma sp.]|nr:AAA family ATPase [Spirosoma sp.]